MNVYLDTEFTGLKTHAEIISIGLVSDDDHFFYAEFNDWKKPTDWVEKNVVPNLTHRNVMTLDGQIVYFDFDRLDIRNNLQIWLSQFNTVQIIIDTGFIDWLLFLDLFNWELPKNVFYMPLDISSLFFLTDTNPDINREDFSQLEHIIKHNAYDDAVVTQHCYHKLMEIL